jgi:hypothetical protein
LGKSYVKGEKLKFNEIHTYQMMLYNRINLFRHIIDVIGKDPDIPPNLIDEIKSSLSTPITHQSLARKIKELRMTRYYENIHFIYNHLLNIPQPPMIPDEVKIEIMRRFTQIVRAHGTVFNGRRSFFNHYFVLIKILKEMRPFPYDIELLSHLDNYKIKSREKLKYTEADWEAVVDFMIRPSTPPRTHYSMTTK